MNDYHGNLLNCKGPDPIINTLKCTINDATVEQNFICDYHILEPNFLNSTRPHGCWNCKLSET